MSRCFTEDVTDVPSIVLLSQDFSPRITDSPTSLQITMKQDTKIYFVEDWGFSLLFFLVSYWWHLVWHETKYIYWLLPSKKDLLVQVSTLLPPSAKGVGYLRNNNEIEDMWDYSYCMNAQSLQALWSFRIAGLLCSSEAQNSLLQIR